MIGVAQPGPTRPALPSSQDDLDKSFDSRLVAIFAGGILWCLSVAYLTVQMALVAPRPHYQALAEAVAALGSVIATAPQRLNATKLKRLGLAVLSGLLGAALVFLCAASAVSGTDTGLMRTWLRERAKFEHDPEGFVKLQQLAHDQFGLTLILGPDEDSYLATTHAAPGSSSGRMQVLPGYCQLDLWPVGIARAFPNGSGNVELSARRMLFGVTVHELGHCIDISRDVASFKDPHVGTMSIAPSERAGVTDARSFVAAERRPETKLWREVYADLFAVGYAKLTWAGDGPVFTRLLLDERTASAQSDPIHATACWLQQVIAAPGPSDLADLPRWAEQHRADPHCQLPPAGPVPTQGT